MSCLTGGHRGCKDSQQGFDVSAPSQRNTGGLLDHYHDDPSVASLGGRTWGLACGNFEVIALLSTIFAPLLVNIKQFYTLV